MKKVYCYYCDKEVDVVYKKEKTNFDYKGISISFVSNISYCKNCNKEIDDGNLNEQFFNPANKAYLDKFNLNIKDFAKIRKDLNLSQDLFSKLLGWSKKTIVRYENQQSLPDPEYLNVYSSLKENKNNIISILIQRKNKISKEIFNKIIKNININYNYDTINTLCFILDNIKELNKTQVMKYMYAIDFNYKKECDIPITNLKYAHAPYGPVIDDMDKFLNTMVRNGILTFEIDEKGILFSSNIESDLSLFDENKINEINKVINKLNGKTAQELSDWTHNFKGWIDTKNGEIIDYKYAKYFDLEEGW